MTSFKKYFWDVIKNHYFDLKGVATRKQYWMFALYHLLFLLPLIVLSVILPIDESLGFSVIFLVLFILFILATILPSVAISVRRLHDIGLSGWFYFLSFIPYVGSLIVFVFHLLPSKIEGNKYYGHKNHKVSADDVDLLDKLHTLKEKGAITQEEFEIKKSELLK